MSLETNGLEMPTFSLIMPSHNRRDHLARAVGQVGRQTYPAHLLELVVVLDGCQDGSAQKLEELRPTLPFPLRIIEQPQRGPGAARNTAIRAATGEYVLMIDDDVMVEPELVMEHWLAHQRQPNTVVIGTMSQPLDYHGPVWNWWEQYILERQYQDILNGKYKVTFRQFYSGNCSLKREWLTRAGLFDENFKRYEDVELAWRLLKLGLGFEFNPAAIGYHYIQRSFASWVRSHYLYGVYAVKIEREKHVPGMIELVYEEFKTRNRFTRLLATRLLNRKLLQRLVTWLLLRLALLGWLIKKPGLSYKLMSCIANVGYWQGFQEELNKDKVAWATPAIAPNQI